MKSTSASSQQDQQIALGGWSRFWFAPTDTYGLCVIRILVGLSAFYYLFSHSFDLIRWFGPHGILSADSVNRLAGYQEGDISYHVSYLNLISNSTVLWIVHLLGMLVVAALVIGAASRVTAVLSVVVVLSYAHRAPMLTGPFEPVLSMLLIYLCLAPSGQHLSLDALWRKKKGSSEPIARSAFGWLGTIALRLMQIHLAGFYLLMGLSKLAGTAWWNGTAVGWLIADRQSGLLDLSGLLGSSYLVDVWTHAIVSFELAFPVLVWFPRTRGVMLWIAVAMWGSLALLTGLVSFAALMLVANLVFLPPQTLRRFVEGQLQRIGAGGQKTAAA